MRFGAGLRPTWPAQRYWLSGSAIWWRLAQESRCSENHEGFYVSWSPIKGTILALRRLSGLSDDTKEEADVIKETLVDAGVVSAVRVPRFFHGESRLRHRCPEPLRAFFEACEDEMKMQRREFSAGLISATLGGSAFSLVGTARAQGAPVEGTHYVQLSQPVPINAEAGKMEVVEFFWYGCPHCNAFEPALEAWVRKLPADVAFRRVPVAFRSEPFLAHQRIYYALEAMGQLGAMHRKVFYAIHNDSAKLDRPAEISTFIGKNGLDEAKFMEVYNSFSVQTKIRQAKQLSEAYKIDGVPSLGIQGRYFTSGTLAGNNDRALEVANYLLQRARKPD